MNTNTNFNARPNITFHRSFPLKRQPMTSICLLAHETSEKLTKKNLLKNINFGTIYAEAYPQYCVGCGLLDDRKEKLTSFGKKAVVLDLTLSKIHTHWLMHYHLSSPFGPGPEFWHELVVSFFKPGTNFSRDDLKEKIATHYWENNAKTLAEKSINSTTTAFINSYLDSEGLGLLNLIEKITDDVFAVNQPSFRYPMILGYALCHFWERVYTGSNSVSLERIIQSDLPTLFLLPKEDFETMLNELKAVGFLDIHRTAQPFQVFLKYGGEFALNQIYGTE